MSHLGEEALKTPEDVRQLVIKIDRDKENVHNICKHEIDALMRMAADVTKMTHKCKMDGKKAGYKTSTDMRQS